MEYFGYTVIVNDSRHYHYIYKGNEQVCDEFGEPIRFTTQEEAKDYIDETLIGDKLIRYVVTDPCYLLSDSVWDKACDDCLDHTEESYSKFNKRIAEELTKITGAPAFASDTGFGDWSNEIHGDNIIKSRFCADAGMVCVCLYTDKIKEHILKMYKEDPETNEANHSFAIFEITNKIEVNFEEQGKQLDRWIQVNISDDLGNTVSSDNYYDEGEEDYE